MVLNTTVGVAIGVPGLKLQVQGYFLVTWAL